MTLCSVQRDSNHLPEKLGSFTLRFARGSHRPLLGSLSTNEYQSMTAGFEHCSVAQTGWVTTISWDTGMVNVMGVVVRSSTNLIVGRVWYLGIPQIRHFSPDNCDKPMDLGVPVAEKPITISAMKSNHSLMITRVIINPLCWTPQLQRV